jgi:hypothetical protein
VSPEAFLTHLRPSHRSLWLPRPAARCLDQYFEKRVRAAEGRGDEAANAIDPRLTAIVERMLEK